MDVQVKEGLTAINSCIDDETVTILVDGLLLGDLASYVEQVTGQSLICRSQLVQGVDMPVGYYQYVGGRHGMDIPEGCHQAVLVHDLCRGLTAGNITKDATVQKSPFTPSAVSPVIWTGVMVFHN